MLCAEHSLSQNRQYESDHLAVTLIVQPGTDLWELWWLLPRAFWFWNGLLGFHFWPHHLHQLNTVRIKKYAHNMHALGGKPIRNWLDVWHLFWPNDAKLEKQRMRKPFQKSPPSCGNI